MSDKSRIAKLERQVAELSGLIRRMITGPGTPVTGAIPEVMVAEGPTAPPVGDPAQVAPFPGCTAIIPPLCSVVVIDADRDPFIVGGAGLLPSQVAVKALIASHPAALAGGAIFADPVIGTGAIVITPGEVDVIGVLKVNGVVVAVP